MLLLVLLLKTHLCMPTEPPLFFRFHVELIRLFQLEGVQDMAAVPIVEDTEESDDPLATPDVDKYIF